MLLTELANHSLEWIQLPDILWGIIKDLLSLSISLPMKTLREELANSGKQWMALKYFIHAYHLRVKYAVVQKNPMYYFQIEELMKLQTDIILTAKV